MIHIHQSILSYTLRYIITQKFALLDAVQVQSAKNTGLFHMQHYSEYSDSSDHLHTLIIKHTYLFFAWLHYNN